MMKQAGSGKIPGEVESAAPPSFFAELKKRRVYRAAVAYAVVAWGGTEILEGVIGGLGWPDWLATLAVILFVTGFPVAMFLAWVFDWTPDGIRRTASSGALGWLPIVAAFVFLFAGSAGLFWLINPSGVVRIEQVGVAILPCRYRGDPELSFRGEGIAEVLNDRLAHSEQLFVPAFASVVAMSAMNQETAQLARDLNVSWLVECRVAELDGLLRIDSSVVDVSTDESSALISQDIQPLKMIDALDAIEVALKQRLGVSHRQGQIAANYTSSGRAFDAYLLGQQAMRIGTADGFAEAREHFRQAQIAGDFNLAHVREADALLAVLTTNSSTPAQEKTTALKAVGLMLDEAERKDIVPAELYASRLRLANIADRLGLENPVSNEQRHVWFTRATELKPNFADPYYLYSEYLLTQGRDDDANEYLIGARKLEPANTTAR